MFVCLAWRGAGRAACSLAEQFEYNVSGTNLAYPHFRPLVPIVEELEALNGWGVNDYTHLHQEAFYNQVSC